MRQLIRTMVVPFFIPLFPAVWYLNRNIMSERLPPYIEPTTELLTTAVGAATLGSMMFAVVAAMLLHQYGTQSTDELSYRQRILHPPDTSLMTFLSFISVILIWGINEIGGLGPAWVGEILQILLVPLAIPLLALAPFAIQFHWAVVLGLVLSVLWISFLANVLSDILENLCMTLLNG